MFTRKFGLIIHSQAWKIQKTQKIFYITSLLSLSRHHFRAICFLFRITRRNWANGRWVEFIFRTTVWNIRSLIADHILQFYLRVYTVLPACVHSFTCSSLAGASVIVCLSVIINPKQTIICCKYSLISQLLLLCISIKGLRVISLDSQVAEKSRRCQHCIRLLPFNALFFIHVAIATSIQATIAMCIQTTVATRIQTTTSTRIQTAISTSIQATIATCTNCHFKRYTNSQSNLCINYHSNLYTNYHFSKYTIAAAATCIQITIATMREKHLWKVSVAAKICLFCNFRTFWFTSYTNLVLFVGLIDLLTCAHLRLATGIAKSVLNFRNNVNFFGHPLFYFDCMRHN